MNARKVSLGLLTLALTSGIGALAHAQEGPPPPYGYHDEHREGPGVRAGLHDGFHDGRHDADKHHDFRPEHAFKHHGLPEYRDEFGPRDEYFRGYHDGFIRGYDRGYHGGEDRDDMR